MLTSDDAVSGLAVSDEVVAVLPPPPPPTPTTTAVTGLSERSGASGGYLVPPSTDYDVLYPRGSGHVPELSGEDHLTREARVRLRRRAVAIAVVLAFEDDGLEGL